MLVIYNETKNAWRHAGVTPNSSKLVNTTTLKDGSVKFLDILYTNALNLPELTDCVEMTECKTVYDGNTNINFQRKDLKPFIATHDTKNTDILLISVNLKGKILKNITNTKAAVLSYIIARGNITFAVSIRDMGDMCKFEFVCHDYTLAQDTTYTFTKVNGKYEVTTKEDQVDEVVMQPTYKIVRFRPNRVTHLVFVIDIDKRDFDNVYPNSERHEVCVVNNLNELEEKVNEYYKAGYRATTLFINETELDKDDISFKKVNSKFKIMNVLLSNGKLTFIR